MDPVLPEESRDAGLRPAWPVASTIPPVSQDRPQVWCLTLDRPREEMELFGEWLSPGERERAERLASDLLRRRFVARRGLARVLLAGALGRGPEELRFRFGAEGKPELEEAEGSSFSLSHSGPLALLALTRGGRVGVDVEALRPRKDLEGVARRTFSPSEVDVLLLRPHPLRLEAFYGIWTRKEALAKGLGMGIASSFQRFSVPLTATGERAPAYLELPGEEVQGWALEGLDPAPGYLGALALEGYEGGTSTLLSVPASGLPEPAPGGS